MPTKQITKQSSDAPRPKRPKRPAHSPQDPVRLASHMRVIPPYDGKPQIGHENILRVSAVAGTGTTRNPFHVVVTDGVHFWTLAPDDVVAVQSPATLAILAESSRVGWPVRFATDLGHDATVIESLLPREPFAWCLREDGTHIGRVVDKSLHTSSRSQLTMRMVADAFGADSCRCYVWDGSTLHTEDSAEHADRRLGELAERRFSVRTQRASSLSPATVATRKGADAVAIEWEMRYGEPFVTLDTWE